ncbi:MAG: hypothetical protein Q9222_007554 [Ikaeria aurantiellina]
MHEHDPLVSEYQHEKQRPRESEALQALRKVASLVKPVMRQRGWRVGILTEFFPPETNLLGLNWNRGQKICLRLRYPGDERQFLPLEQVVDTMLHELCHNVHGPHNEAFHNLWNQLRDEHESLIRKGYTGEGFLSEGRKLGGGYNRIPMHEAQRRARAAAEKRRTLTAGSGQKLGGAGVRRGQDIRQVIADAAQRRIDIMRGCGDTDTARVKEIVDQTNRSGFKTMAEEDDANEEAIMLAYIDLVQEEEREKYGNDYVPPSKDNPAGSQGRIPFTPIVKSESGTAAKPPVPHDTKPKPPERGEGGAPIPTHIFDLDDPTSASDFSTSWTCNICTLVNPPTYLSCDACGTDRPSPPPSPPNSSNTRRPPSSANPSLNNDRSRIPKKTDKLDNIRSLSAAIEQKAQSQPVGWECVSCGNWMESQWWTCGRCGTMKTKS